MRPLAHRLRPQSAPGAPASVAEAARGALAAAVSSRAYHAPLREMNFLLYDVHNFEGHYKGLNEEVLTPCDRETVDMVVDATKTMCEDVLAPLNEGGDRVGSVWKLIRARWQNSIPESEWFSSTAASFTGLHLPLEATASASCGTAPRDRS